MFANPIIERIRCMDLMLKRIADEKMGSSDRATMMHHWVVGFLYEREEDTFPKDIGKAFHMNRSTTSEMLKLMEKNGLIKSESVAMDARLKKITLTEEGYAIYEKMESTRRSIDSIVFDGFTDEETQQLKHLLDKMYNNGMSYINREKG